VTQLETHLQRGLYFVVWCMKQVMHSCFRVMREMLKNTHF